MQHTWNYLELRILKRPVWRRSCGFLDKIEDAFEDLGEWVKHWDKDHDDDDRPPAGVPQGPVYVGLLSTNVTITGVQLPRLGMASVAFRVENVGTLPPGGRYTFQVQQIVAGKVVGQRVRGADRWE